MGFKRLTYKLVFPEESRWAGLEVRMRGLTIGELNKISQLQGANGLTAVDEVMDILQDGMISWNLENEDDSPVSINDMRDEDSAMLLAIVNAWTEVVGDVPAPLPSGSSNGEKLAEGLIPMEIPSSSHPNLSTPN